MKTTDENDDADLEVGDAANDLAEAFNAIEKYKDMIPHYVYEEIADVLTRWVANTDWLSHPAARREALPSILSVAISQEAASEVVEV